MRRSRTALTRALQGGGQLTRAELAQVLRRARIGLTESQRLGQLLMRAELDGIVCSGAPRGKQATYALLEERVPPAAPLERDAALLELTLRYFATRGPATLKDFAWWSGPTQADAGRGVEIAGRRLTREVIGGRANRSASPSASTAADTDGWASSALISLPKTSPVPAGQ